MNEVRVRFLGSILEQLPLERIVEIHFFPSIRQGQVETGVAVIAADPKIVGLAPVADVAQAESAQVEVAEGSEESSDSGNVAVAIATADETADEDDSPYAEIVAAAPVPIDRHRHEVLTAVYRWTRKGADRGKWEVDVKSEADAPLPTVDIVVRGVRDRSGEELEPQRYDNEGIRTVMASPAWPTTA